MLLGYDAQIAILLLCALLVAFVRERYPPEVTAAAGAAMFVLLGLVPTDAVMAAFSNPAPITIAAMFVLSGALVRTGLLDAFATLSIDHARRHPLRVAALFVIGTIAASAFVNNTPIVLVLIPVVMRLAITLDIAPTRLLIPLSYLAILGGTCSLIGTSTNLLVDGVAREIGLERFGIFEIAPVGLIAAACGGALLLVLGPWLLPDRRSGTSADAAEARFLSELNVHADSPLIGQRIGDLPPLARPGIRLQGLRAGKAIRRIGLQDHRLRRGDAIIVTASAAELLALREDRRLRTGLQRSVDPLPADAIVSEAVVGSSRRHAGARRLADLMLGRRFGIRVLGVHRHGHVAGADLGSVQLRGADRLLLEGSPAGLAALAQSGLLVSVTQAHIRPFRRDKAPIALAVLLAVVALAAFEIGGIGLLALLGVVVILVARCLESEEAWGTLDGSVLVLILAMLIVGEGLEYSGALDLVTSGIAPWLATQSPWVTLIAVYALTSLLTELVTNSAVAIVLTPIVIGLAHQNGIDPRPLVVAVMFGASASFASPIGYQTNTLVYGAGDYRFVDFLCIGVPMNIVVGVVSIIAIPVFFPF